MKRVLVGLALSASALVAQPVTKDAPATYAAPDGWTIRLDDKDRAQGAAATKFVTMGSGFHVTSGPASLYYRAADQVTAPFAASVAYGQRKAPAHPEAYGLFFGGRNLQEATQEYFYFLVRGDGKYYVAHRAGPDVHEVVPWTAHGAVNRQNEAGVASNVLGVDVTADSVHLLVNQTRVQSFGKLPASGQVGLRVNHGLDVHISEFRIRKP